MKPRKPGDLTAIQRRVYETACRLESEGKPVAPKSIVSILGVKEKQVETAIAAIRHVHGLWRWPPQRGLWRAEFFGPVKPCGNPECREPDGGGQVYPSGRPSRYAGERFGFAAPICNRCYMVAWRAHLAKLERDGDDIDESRDAEYRARIEVVRSGKIAGFAGKRQPEV